MTLKPFEQLRLLHSVPDPLGRQYLQRRDDDYRWNASGRFHDGFQCGFCVHG